MLLNLIRLKGVSFPLLRVAFPLGVGNRDTGRFYIWWFNFLNNHHLEVKIEGNLPFSYSDYVKEKRVNNLKEVIILYVINHVGIQKKNNNTVNHMS